MHGHVSAAKKDGQYRNSEADNFSSTYYMFYIYMTLQSYVVAM